MRVLGRYNRIENLTGLVVKEAMYCWNRLPANYKESLLAEDLVQEGFMLLTAARKSYSIEFGVKFSSFATNTLQRYYRNVLETYHTQKRTCETVPLEGLNIAVFRDYCVASVEVMELYRKVFSASSRNLRGFLAGMIGVPVGISYERDFIKKIRRDSPRWKTALPEMQALCKRYDVSYNDLSRVLSLR